MKLEFSQQIFETYWDIKFHENLSSGSQVVLWRWMDGQMDKTDMTNNNHISQFYECAWEKILK